MAVIAVLVGIFFTATIAYYAYHLGQTKLSERQARLTQTLDSIPAVPSTADEADKNPDKKVRINWLVGIGGEVDGKAFLVGHRTITIGREPSNHIQINDNAASRKHCQIAPRDGALHVIDMNSKNGLRINGTPVASGRLGPGDQLQIGQAKWVFHLKGTFGDDAAIESKESNPAAFDTTGLSRGSSLKYMLKSALEQAGGDIDKAAAALGVDAAQLRRMLEKNTTPGG